MKTTSKKKVDNFVRKIAPARENPGYAYGWKINQHMADWVDKHWWHTHVVTFWQYHLACQTSVRDDDDDDDLLETISACWQTLVYPQKPAGFNHDILGFLG